MDDNSVYRDIFFEETETHLTELNDDLLALEENPEEIEIMNSIFRSAHTLKGMAATMGYETMATLTHQMENVFEQLKNKELQVTHEIISLIFDCLDTLSSIVEELQVDDHVDQEVDITNLTNRLFAILREDSSVDKEKIKQANMVEKELIPALSNFDSSDQRVITEGQLQGYYAYTIACQLADETSMKSARAFLLLNKLETAGDIILSEPNTEELEDEDFGNVLNILYLTKLDKQEIEDLIMSINEIEQVVIIDTEEMSDHSNLVSHSNEKEVVTDKKTKTEHKSLNQSKQTIRVDLNRLDQFMNLVSELVIHRSRLEVISQEHNMHEINESLEQVERITSELQDVVLQLRMQPFSVAVQRFPRMIRDLADELDKELKLVIEGEDTELDRTVVTELGEPLIHLLRNAADHGIESPADREKLGKPRQGTITVRATQEGNRVVVTVSDDGKGLDPKIIKESAEQKEINTENFSEEEIKQLIFHPGFSTKKKVTDVSGRGVGMDVVKEKITSLNGSIEIESELGKGSSFRITLPLTLSIIQSLLVQAGEEIFALPQTVIEKVEQFDPSLITTTHQADVYHYKEEFIPVVYLSEVLGFESNTTETPYVIIIVDRDRYYAVVVDGLLGQKEIVIKDLGLELNIMKEYLGATILGDGEVILIIDLSTICAAERGKAI